MKIVFHLIPIAIKTYRVSTSRFSSIIFHQHKHYCGIFFLVSSYILSVAKWPGQSQRLFICWFASWLAHLRKATMLPNAKTAEDPRSKMCYGSGPWYHIACWYFLGRSRPKRSHAQIFFKLATQKGKDLLLLKSKKNGGSSTSFWREYAPKNTLNLKIGLL